MRRVTESQRREDALRSALARLPFAVVVIDDKRVLQPINDAAATLMRCEGIAGDLLHARPGHPLSVLVRTVVESPAGSKFASVDVEFPSGRRYVVEPSRRSEKGFERWLVLLLSEDSRRPARTEDLFDAWELTTREREVAQGIAAGKATEEICSTLGIALTTFKSHVAQVLKKSGSRNRSEFLARLLRRD